MLFGRTITVALDGSGEFSTIQAAIDAADPNAGDVIVVGPGTYAEAISFGGKNIALESTEPDDWDVVKATTIKGNEASPVVTLTAGQAGEISGFTITGGGTGGILGNACTVSVSNCIITGNNKNGPGAGIHGVGTLAGGGEVRNCIIRFNSGWASGGLAACHGTITNCLIVNNTGAYGGGVVNCDGSIVNCTIAYNSGPATDGVHGCDGSITNCVIWGNSPGQITNSSTPRHSCIQNWGGGGVNIDADPMFADAEDGDYRLLPWSPCVDAGTDAVAGGLPAADTDGGPRVLDGDADGTAVVDMGAYEAIISEEAVIVVVDPNGLSFTVLQDGALPEAKSLKIANGGLETLNFAVSYDCAWLRIEPVSGNLVSGESVELTAGVLTNDLAPGVYTCEVAIADPAAVNSPQIVQVSYEVIGPRLAASKSSLDFGVVQRAADPDPQTFTVQNTGGAFLDWMIDPNTICEWLTVEPASGRLGIGESRSVQIGIVTDALALGRYTCGLRISAPGADNAEAIIMVELVVRSHDVLYVPDVYPTIQAAIDAAADGDTVVVADGVYSGEGNKEIDFRGKAIAVRSAGGAAKCIIDCEDAGRGFYFHNGEGNDSVLDGFTIRNGHLRATSFYESKLGGGICCTGAAPTIMNCWILSCQVESISGFDDDPAPSLGGGGGISGCDGPILNCIIKGNRAFGVPSPYDLGGVNRGAGLYDCDGPIVNCLITGNMADDEGYFYSHSRGGGLCDCDGLISNCVIEGNVVRIRGAQPHWWESGGAGLYNCNGSIVNCTIVRNTLGNGPGSLEEDLYRCGGLIRNCIVAGGGNGINIYDCRAAVEYSNVTGGYPGVGNIDVDPLFADAENGDFHLKSAAGRWEVTGGYMDDKGTPSDPNDDVWVPGQGHWVYDDVTSPCIDAGDPASDWRGELWPHGGRINMGAYGGTRQASMSLNPVGNVADLDYDDTVGLGDFGVMALEWGAEAAGGGGSPVMGIAASGGPPWVGDLDRDGVVGLSDLAVFAERWAGGD